MNFSSLVINAVDAYGRNALHYAVLTNNEPLATMLLHCPQCDPNLPDRDGMTPLHMAAQQNSPGLAYALLSEPAEISTNPNVANREGHTPLHLAGAAGYTEVIRVLLQSSTDQPCDPNIVDARQMTASQLARAYQREECAALIENYARDFTGNASSPPTGSAIAQLAMAGPMANRQNMLSPSGRLDDDSSADSSGDSSTASSGQIQISSGQWTDRTDKNSTSGGAGPETKSLAEMIKRNPLQPPGPAAAPQGTGHSTSAIGALMGGIPLRTGPTASTNQTS